MSARTDLITQLTGDLPAYRTSAEPPGTDTLLKPGKARLWVERAGATPTQVSAGWAQALTVYLIVGPEAYVTAEDELDTHLPVVVAALEARHYPIISIDRDVFFNENDGRGFHGYRITLTAITTNL